MSEKRPTMWENEAQNALLHVESIFCIGDKVVIKNSNPGTEGTIIGIMDPRLFYSGCGGTSRDHMPSVIRNWCVYNKVDSNELLNHRVYTILFDTPKDNLMLHESVPEEVRAAHRTWVTAASEIDIVPAAQYWAEFEEYCEGEPDGETGSKTTHEEEG